MDLLLRTQGTCLWVWWLVALFRMKWCSSGKGKSKGLTQMWAWWFGDFAVLYGSTNWVVWKDDLPSAAAPPSTKGGGEGTAHLLCEGKWKGEKSILSCLCFPGPWHQQCETHLVLPSPQTHQTSQCFWDTFCSVRFRNSTWEHKPQKECNGAEFNRSSAPPPRVSQVGTSPQMITCLGRHGRDQLFLPVHAVLGKLVVLCSEE